MATYYVRKTGSDANAGTSAGAAFLTVGKAITSVAAADTVWIGAGTYRAALTLSTSGSAGNIITWNGDVDGAHTGDAGDVVLTPFTVNDFTAASTAILTLSGHGFQTFNNLIFIGASGNLMVDANTQTAASITFADCAFIAHPAGNTQIQIAAAANVALNWTWNRCLFQKCGQAAIQLIIDTPATADFNVNVLLQNCVFTGGSANCITIQQGTTTNTFKYGGITVYNCSHLGSGTFMRAVDTNHSTSVTSAVYNCALYNASGTGLQAFALGQILEDYNAIACSTPRSNVTAGTHSVTAYAPGIEYGQAWITGRAPRPFGMPTVNSPLLGFGTQGSGPTVDFTNSTRPGGVRLLAYGTATAGAAKTLTDSGQIWGVNAFAGATLVITGGTGSGQSKSITSNTTTVITVDGNWKTNPNNTSTYQVLWGDLSSTGTATAGTTTTLTDGNAAWGTNQWTGYILHTDTGTGSGQTLTITSNTATVLTFAVATAPDNTTTYSLYKATGLTTQDYAVGAYERQNNAEKETVTTDAGGVGIRIVGYGAHDFLIPVTNVSTVITVRVQYDGNHGTGAKPQASLLANGEIGNTLDTQTAAGAAGSWETLTFGAFTPSVNGVVTLRLQSRSAASNGVAYFDTVTVV